MKRNVLTYLYWILTVLPMIIAIAIFNYLPDQIPAHYNFQGEVDRWGSKWEMFILPTLSIVFGGILYPIIMWQMKRNDKGNVRALQVALLILPVTFLAIFIMMSVSAFQSIEDVSTIPFMKYFVMVIGLMFSAMGFEMRNIKMNHWFGIRTFRTLQSEEVWKKTHHFGGKVWMIGGIAIALIAFFVNSDLMSIFVLLGGVVVLTIVPIIYSHRV